MTDPRNETDPLPNGWTWEQAIDAACERSCKEPVDSNQHIQSVRAFARMIAQHEKPPVDEATELLADIYTALGLHEARDAILSGIVHGQDSACESIIRDALAKARAGK